MKIIKNFVWSLISCFFSAFAVWGFMYFTHLKLAYTLYVLTAPLVRLIARSVVLEGVLLLCAILIYYVGVTTIIFKGTKNVRICTVLAHLLFVVVVCAFDWPNWMPW